MTLPGFFLLALVMITSRSVGCYDYCHNECSSYTQMENTTFVHTYPGLQIVAFTNSTNQINDTIQLEVLENKTEEKKLENFLKSIHTNSLVLLTMHRKCSAKMNGWYDMIIKYGPELNLKQIYVHNYESAIIMACKGNCPGNSSETLPLYRFVTLGAGPLFVDMNFTIEVEDAQEKKPALRDDSSEKDSRLIIILTAVSILFVITISSILICVCCRKFNSETRISRSSFNENKGTKVKGWTREKRKSKINKVIQKSKTIPSGELRKSYSSEVFRSNVESNVESSVESNVVRSSMHVNSFTSYQHISAAPNNNDDVFIQRSNTTGIIPQITTPSSNSIVGLNESKRESRIYLEPIDANISEYVRNDDAILQSMLKFTLTKTHRSKSLNHLDVNVTTFPTTSSLLFTSDAKITSSSLPQSTLRPEDDEGVKTYFAEYIATEGIIYKSPSNVRKHDPPNYIPTRKPSCDSISNDSVVSHDYEHPVDPPTLEARRKSQPANDSPSQTISAKEHYTGLKDPYDPHTYRKLEISATDF